DPVHSVRVKLELVYRQGVVEDGHGPLADHDEFLLLVWMKPAHEDVALDTALEGQRAQGDVGHLAAQIARAVTGHTRRGLAEEAEHDMDIVGCEAPERILLGPNPPQVETIRIHILD